MLKAHVFLCLTLCIVADTAIAITPILFGGGSGPPNVVPTGRDVCWSEPADLNGLWGSSEQILDLGLESEFANDFVMPGNISHVTFWGAYYNTDAPCVPGMTTPGFNLKFYEDAGCVPGTILAYIVVTTFVEQSVGCQSGEYPLFKWDADAPFIATIGNRYWFGAQVRDHPFPPQVGRLAAASVTGCMTMFISAYWGYPEWTPSTDVFFMPFDASQEFTCFSEPPYPGACCVGSDCRTLYEDQCSAEGGQYQGDGTPCNPNPCVTVPVRRTTWSKIKGSYR